MCAAGKNQSPVNLTEMVEGDLPEIAIDYASGGNEIVNNGHTIQVGYAPGSIPGTTAGYSGLFLAADDGTLLRLKFQT